METTKYVISIIKMPDSINGYEEHYYFLDVALDKDGHLIARSTGNIWDAMKFNYGLNIDETKRILSLIEFIKTCYIPKKKYKISIIPITLNYEM